MNSDLHYWLQRSKCLYRYETSREKLTEAYSYAKKVYDDGWEAIHYKSALTVSLICCALAEKDRGLEKTKNIKTLFTMLRKLSSPIIIKSIKISFK